MTPAVDVGIELRVALDTVWVLVAAALVFFMNAGFALLEAGLCRRKNTVNILAKNFAVFALAAIAYWAVGFALMFGDGNGFMGTAGFFLSGADASPVVGDGYSGVFGALAWAGIPLEAKFFFQLAFAATAASIVSGAVAERIQYRAYLLFSALLVAVLYPVVGHWVWGGGFLAEAGMLDFAGSTVVHGVGGWAALAGAIVLGPRLGRYRSDGTARAIPGHSMPLATIGAFILWFGWIGFNGGSTMAATPAIAHILVTTNMSAAAGVLAAMAVSWLWLGKPDLSMIMNGALAGLVAITAGCAYVGVGASVLIGAVAGTVVVLAIVGIDRVRVDDPVGAIAVHLGSGVIGTLAVGLLADPVVAAKVGGVEATGLLYGGGFGLLAVQARGAVTVGCFAFGLSMAGWAVLRATLGLRVAPEEELAGLDRAEMGLEAYPEDPLAFASPAFGGAAPARPEAGADIAALLLAEAREARGR